MLGRSGSKPRAALLRESRQAKMKRQTRGKPKLCDLTKGEDDVVGGEGGRGSLLSCLGLAQ